jgi:hypothetical protein
MDLEQLARCYVLAQSGDEAAAGLLAENLDEDVVLQTSRAEFRGREAVLAQIGAEANRAAFREAAWGQPKPEGDSLRLEGRLPLEALTGGFDLCLRSGPGGRIVRIEQLTLPAPPLPAGPVRLSPAMREAIGAAWRSYTILVISVDDNGYARPTLRGTVQAWGDDCLAFWARNAEGGTVGNLASNPRLTLFYREPPARTTLTFYGRARLHADEAERSAVYDASPEAERASDPQKRGVAVIVELERVEGTFQGRRVRMQRDAVPLG